jgi:hypothetical protein
MIWNNMLMAGSASAEPPEFRGAAAFTSSLQSPGNLPAITGQLAGDLLVLFATCTNAFAMNTPSGWTLRLAYVFGTDISIYVVTRIASTDGQLVSPTWTGVGNKSYHYAAWSKATGVDVVGTPGATSSNTTVSAPSITPTRLGSLLAMTCMDSSTGIVSSVPSDLVQLSTSNGPTSKLYEGTSNPAGPLGTRDFVWGATTAKIAALMQIY